VTDDNNLNKIAFQLKADMSTIDRHTILFL